MVKSLKTLEVNFQCENCEYERLLGFYSQDVKESVLQFNECLDMVDFKDFKDSAEIIFLKRKYKEIFGDWKK